MPPPGAGRAAPAAPQQFEPPPYGPPPHEPAPYAAAPQYSAPAPPYDPYGQPEFPSGRPYDTGVTQVFDTGALRTGPYGAAPTMGQGAAPAFDDEFARSATARIDFGPHEAFGPPPEEVEPEPEPDAAHVFSRLRRIRSHARQKRTGSRRWVGIVVVLLLFAVAAAVKFAPFSPWSADPSADGVPENQPIPFHPATFTAADVATQGFLSWAYQDWRTSGLVVGSANRTETTPATSMISVWLAADLLRRGAEQGTEPSDAQRLDIEAMIRDDDRAAAERILNQLGGHAASVERLSTMCRLTDTQPADLWLRTTISAQDAARLGGCIADRTAAGAEWTPWLLSVMKQVRGSGGIRDAFPSQVRPTIAIKNGVLLDETTNEWTANCLAIGDGWSLAVLQRYPASGDEAADLAHVDAVCQQVVGRLTGP